MDDPSSSLRRSISGKKSQGSGSWLQRVVSQKLDDFNVEAKSADKDSLQKWRTASLVLNASRRFRYTANLEKRVANMSSLHQFRVGGIAIEALRRFQAGMPSEKSESFKLAKKEGFEISSRNLESLIDKSDRKMLHDYGGVKGLAGLLQTDLKGGVQATEPEIARRQAAYGTNTYTEKPSKSYLSFLWDASQDVTLIILAVCAIVSILVGIPTEGLSEGWYDGAGIGFSVLIVIFVTASSDYQQSLQFQGLDAEKKKVFVDVVRSGQRQKLLVFDIVVGDIVLLSIGDIVPADGLFIDGHSLVIDESSMTGESEPQHKDHENPFLQAGCKVQDGSARLLVTGVGMKTQWGHLMATLGDSGDDETPLQVRLSGVATLVGNLGLVVASLVFVILMTRYFIDTGFTFPAGTIVQIVKFFAIAVTIIVVAVPEGLPLAVTLTLAFAMKKMMADKALVRHLAACETMGSATTICSDKTGTLTTNQMTVARAWLGGLVRTVQAAKKQGLSSKLLDVILENIYQNTAGDVDASGNVLGSPTETAILKMAADLGGSFQEVRSASQVVAVEPFNSKRKSMAAVVKLANGQYRVHWKGAAEIILEKCTRMAGGYGEIIPMEKGTLEGVINGFAEDALRTLSLAYRDLQPSEVPKGGKWPADQPIPSDDLTLLCIVGIKDPLRPGVTRAVQLCQSAGIKVRMVTGDNITTAKAIATECGIFTDGVAIEGPTFRELSQEQMREVIPKIQVMARSSPSDKLTLVKELRAMGEVVAVTGDGTNDAPALKESDIGLAMGIAGTEVAKESADIIVLDDNFATIVQVAKWGRSVYCNIQKFVQFQLTVNVVALTLNFVSACITGTAPLTAVQLLWVNLIMDTLGALALATEAPEDALMLKPPVGRTGRFISNVMWRNVFGQAIFQLAVLGLLQVKGAEWLGLEGQEDVLNTLTFNAFVFCQVFNEFNSRDMERVNVLKNLFGNYLFMMIITVTVLFQVVLVEFLGAFASTVPLPLDLWALSVAIGFAGMPLAALVKFIPVPKETPLQVREDADEYQPLADGEP